MTVLYERGSLSNGNNNKGDSPRRHPFGMTPFRAALIHLILIGWPMRFGLLPTGWGRRWLSEVILPSATTMFPAAEGAAALKLTELEELAVRDLGTRFILHYELSLLMVCLLRNNANRSILSCLHHTLAASSLVTLLFVSALQYARHALEDTFFTSMVLFYLVAITVSQWAIHVVETNKQAPSNSSSTTHVINHANNNGTTTPAAPPAVILSRQNSISTKWSFPGNAIYCGVAVNVMVVIASVQALVEHEGLERYYHHDHGTTTATTIFKTSFLLGILFTALHAFMLLSLRNLMSVQELRAICLYKLLLNIVFPLFWIPEFSDWIRDDLKHVAYTLRIAVAVTYLCGFLMAGRLDNIGRILTSEKAV